LGYVGYDAHKLTSLVDINPFPLGSNTRIYNPDSTNSVFSQSAGVQECRSSELQRAPGEPDQALRQFKVGNAFYTFAYTWSHELDNASGFRQRNSQVPYYDEHYFWASGDTDVRQVIAFSGGWDLPFDRAWQGGPKLLTKGWSLYPIVTWRTGFPLDVSPAERHQYRSRPGGRRRPQRSGARRSGIAECSHLQPSSRGALPPNDFQQSLLSEHFFPLVFRVREAVGIHHQNVSLYRDGSGRD
jgi:hypothetical protein